MTLIHSSDISLNVATIFPYTLKLSTKSLAINLYCTNHLFNFVFTYIKPPQSQMVSNIEISNHIF